MRFARSVTAPICPTLTPLPRQLSVEAHHSHGAMKLPSVRAIKVPLELSRVLLCSRQKPTVCVSGLSGLIDRVLRCMNDLFKPVISKRGSSFPSKFCCTGRIKSWSCFRINSKSHYARAITFYRLQKSTPPPPSPPRARHSAS